MPQASFPLGNVDRHKVILTRHQLPDLRGNGHRGRGCAENGRSSLCDFSSRVALTRWIISC
jgi:hypothetical protein